jgi:hypothetical protein
MTARLVWTAGLTVALAAAVATAHGGFEVARAAGVPTPIALTYPAITDGLALVAYATTTRLSAAGRRYAWAVVILAAGLSGTAQAAGLAGGVHAVPTGLRLGVGAWPAIAAAVAAHLMFLLARGQRPGQDPAPYNGIEQLYAPCTTPVPLNAPLYSAVVRDELEPGNVEDDTQPIDALGPIGSQSERALAAAMVHLRRHHALPTVSQLVQIAGVSRGTAAAALRQLRRESDRSDS